MIHPERRGTLLLILLAMMFADAVGSSTNSSNGITSTRRHRHLRYSAYQGSCGFGSVDTGICSNSTMCCSPMGWCLSDTVYCISDTRNSPSELPCGFGNVGNGTCLSNNPNVCCSTFGWCGDGSEYCNNPFKPPTGSPSKVSNTETSTTAKPAISPTPSRAIPTVSPSAQQTGRASNGAYYGFGDQYYVQPQYYVPQPAAVPAP